MKIEKKKFLVLLLFCFFNTSTFEKSKQHKKKSTLLCSIVRCVVTGLAVTIFHDSLKYKISTLPGSITRIELSKTFSTAELGKKFSIAELKSVCSVLQQKLTTSCTAANIINVGPLVAANTLIIGLTRIILTLFR